MLTGTGAWIANHKFGPQDDNIRIDLPGNWYWDISANGIGFLKGPKDELCVGYNLADHTIQFGSNGKTEAPGLNLWTIQEMGEKFARENFMNAETRKEYDIFSEKRMNERKAYEKGVRTEMTGLIQLELYEGEWTAHVNTEAVKRMTGIESKPEISREEGIALFNKMSEARQVMPLRDPMGYMTLDGSLYHYVKDQYEFQYNDTIDNIDAGFINGNGHGCEAVLGKLDATVRKNMREFCMPEGISYLSTRHIKATPELQDAANAFVKQRVTKTVNFEKKRSHSPESLARDHEKFLAAANVLKEKISDAAFPSMDVSISEETGIGMKV